MFYPYLVPSSDRSFKLPKLPEFFFLAKSAMIPPPSERPSPQQVSPNRKVSPQFASYQEPHPNSLDSLIWAEISQTVEAIRARKSDTRILLSYIPSGTAIYGDLILDCPECEDFTAYQRENSAELEALSGRMQIEYVDITPDLQALAGNVPLWSGNFHFNSDTYARYAHFLVDAIQSAPR